jgi:phosphopantothenoylcysteine decarboxylase/phosphopantothenate--cysteine ligase
VKDRTILYGVTGSIAAYKACDAVFELRRRGARVRVVMTRAARRLVTAETFRALSGQPVHGRMWNAPDDPVMPHIALAEGVDLFVVAPATAHFLAEMAHGLAGDLLSALALTVRAPTLVAPAMNVQMWEHPATQANVRTLLTRGVHVLEPEEGLLACGVEGKGKMASVERLLGEIGRILGGP